ncbi:MAG: hypothetical protein IJD56_02785 [Peptococcaceae bacterium]|nr:hypothetical protein [Peptococcaceae bacterium]
MRIEKIKIDGEEYPVCYSAGVLQQMEERFGADNPFNFKTTRDSIWVLHIMLKAAAGYYKLKGMDYKEPPTEEALAILMGPDDFKEMYLTVSRAIQNGSATKVQVENEDDDSKNVTATPSV